MEIKRKSNVTRTKIERKSNGNRMKIERNPNENRTKIELKSNEYRTEIECKSIRNPNETRTKPEWKSNENRTKIERNPNKTQSKTVIFRAKKSKGGEKLSQTDKGVLMYFEWFEAMSRLDPKTYKTMMNAIYCYQQKGEKPPEFKGKAQVAA